MHVVYIYVRAYIHLLFKHAVLGIYVSCLGLLSENSELVCFAVNEREDGVVALPLPIGPHKRILYWSRCRDANPVPINPLVVDLASAPLGPVYNM